MASRNQIVAFLDDLLEISSYSDYGPNGLLVPGADEVTKVVTGVSAQRELFERAAQEGAQLVLCHHGLFWDFHPRTISPTLKERLRVLFDADLSLAAYHVPLDAHPEVGNNAIICDRLGLELAEPFADFKGRTTGFVARSAQGIPFTELRQRCATAFGQEPFVWDTGPEHVHSVGIVSGSATDAFDEAVALGLDAFLTGEVEEHVMADARESGVHFIAGGHYATEVFGVRRLGELLSERFAVEHQFVDIPNPI
jgi:dinuclear metal center YbgI/SA1388 family protein